LTSLETTMALTWFALLGLVLLAILGLLAVGAVIVVVMTTTRRRDQKNAGTDRENSNRETHAAGPNGNSEKRS
jgi:hypothetical protein